jgi:hypothetical protein
MGFFDEFLKKADPHPEDHYKVTITDTGIKVDHPQQIAQSVLWLDLHTILLINTDEGPCQPDVWLNLIGRKSWCVIPQGAEGFEIVYDIVSKYEGFNFNNFSKSMSCTDNAEFLLWTNKI